MAGDLFQFYRHATEQESAKRRLSGEQVIKRTDVSLTRGVRGVCAGAARKLIGVTRAPSGRWRLGRRPGRPHVNPMGTKGIGGIGIVGNAAAVANAVCNATGIRVRDLPITPDKLLCRGL